MKIINFLIVVFLVGVFMCSCENRVQKKSEIKSEIYQPDTTKYPEGPYGEMVKYGRALMLNSAYYIGPDGINGHYLGNKMNCTNCHQNAGIKPFSFNLLKSHQSYPQYRARENKVISLAERINNCVTRPHNGKPLPLDSKEMIALLSYFRWINMNLPDSAKGIGNLNINFPDRAADPKKGEKGYMAHCKRCHGDNGEGQWNAEHSTYLFPPLWGNSGYQPGSSMHRVIMQAKWLKANMPFDSAKWNKPVLTDEECLDIAAFVNNDEIHPRPDPKSLDYANIKEKAIDYDKGPYPDPFSELQHKFGPFKPIIDYWNKNGLKPRY